MPLADTCFCMSIFCSLACRSSEAKLLLRRFSKSSYRQPFIQYQNCCFGKKAFSNALSQANLR